MDSEGELIRRLIQTGDPDVLRSGLISAGWPGAIAAEQAASMRLGLDPAGIESQIMQMAKQFPRQSPGPYETLSGNTYGRKPSPRQKLRRQYEEQYSKDHPNARR